MNTNISAAAWLLLGMCAVAGMTTVNPWLTVFALLSLGVAQAIVWRSDSTRLFAYILGYHWLQASVDLLRANFSHVDLDAFYVRGGNAELATALALLATVVLAIGVRLGLGASRSLPFGQPDDPARLVSSRGWFFVYICAAVIAVVATIAGGLIPSLRFPLSVVAHMKFAALWILAYATFSDSRQMKGYFYLAIAFEVLTSFGGFFASFTTPLVVSILAISSAKAKLTFRQLSAVFLSALTLVSMVIIWTAVKEDYRKFASGDSQRQVVVVTYRDTVQELTRLISALDRADIVDAMEKLIARISYTEFFGLTLDYVPAVTDHEWGAIWGDALLRPLMPRFLFPDKVVYDDSSRTRLYTGASIAGADEGTSISIGYIAESYVDFGLPWMFVPIALLGLFMGRICRALSQNGRNGSLVGHAVSFAALLPMALTETSITRSFGGLIGAAMGALVILRYVFPAVLPHLARMARRG